MNIICVALANRSMIPSVDMLGGNLTGMGLFFAFFVVVVLVVGTDGLDDDADCAGLTSSGIKS
jgi:hypothetical protein